jgi:hypothetical protein
VVQAGSDDAPLVSADDPRTDLPADLGAAVATASAASMPGGRRLDGRRCQAGGRVRQLFERATRFAVSSSVIEMRRVGRASMVVS